MDGASKIETMPLTIQLSCEINVTGTYAQPQHTFQTAAPSRQDADLDWGDFFFNLISMCIVYAHFSEAGVGGETNAAVLFSMAIAGVDIVLLLLRWLWHERFVSYRLAFPLFLQASSIHVVQASSRLVYIMYFKQTLSFAACKIPDCTVGPCKVHSRDAVAMLHM